MPLLNQLANLFVNNCILYHMRHLFKTLTITCSLGICVTASSCMAKDNANSKPIGNTLIELFTSEGCSSCPKADKTVAELQKQYKENLLVLCYHVDYWNYLGWKDLYSSANNTERQQHYANAFHLNSAYTPEAVINGREEYVGSDKARLTAAILKSKQPAGTLTVSTQFANNTLGVTIGGKRDQTAIVCLVQKQASSQVNRGENEGKKLEHINIVRDFVSIPARFNSSTFDLPRGFKKEDYFIAILLQDDKTLAISSWVTGNIQ